MRGAGVGRNHQAGSSNGRSELPQAQHPGQDSGPRDSCETAHFLGPVWWWIGLPAGAAYGLAAYLISIGVSGDLLDRRMPELLATISPNRAN